jgi:autotransporter-associated beta strand protein
MRKHVAQLRVPLLACACCSVANASSLVWQDTFTTGPNGVTQFDTAGGNEMIGTVVNDQLPVTTVDNGTNAYTPDKAGEPLGAPVTGQDAFSGLYNFDWSNLNPNDESDIAYEAAGFLGTAGPQTRQIMGVILRHWYVPQSEAINDIQQGYYVGLDLAFGSVGITDFGYNGSDPALFLGNNSPTATMQLAIGFDPTSNTLSASLFDGSGNLLESHDAVINMTGGMYGAHPPAYDSNANIQSELNDLSATYLGWEDYTGNGNDIPTTWNMNSLSYFNTATGAFNAVVVNTSLSWNNANGTGDGLTWDFTNQNWSNGSPANYVDGANVTFNDVNSGHYNVTLNTTVTPGSVTVNNSSSNYTITGAGSIAGATTALTKLGSGVLTLSNTGINTYGGGTTVSAGTLLIGAAGALPAASDVTITGGTLQLGQNTGGQTLSALSVTGGSFDIGNNHFILSYTGSQATEDATIRGYLVSGYAGGAWTGPGIDSSSVGGSNQYSVGYADGSDGIVAGLSPGQIEVKYTLTGDANLDGVVNGTDFGILAAHFGQQATAWDQGDFNYDGVVNGSDFGALAGNFGQQANGADVALPASDWAALDAFAAANGLLADVPEPGSLGLLTLGVVGVLARRRNRLKA